MDDTHPEGKPAFENSAASSSGSQPRPVAEINLVQQPELDRNPSEFAQLMSESKRTADAAPGGGAPTEVAYVPFEEKPYNPDASRDATRQTITLWLIGLLCALIGLTFVALFARGMATGFTDKSFFGDLKQVLDVLVGPVITLLASAVGFYFGSKQGEVIQQNKNNKI